jgi:hypothetical protein
MNILYMYHMLRINGIGFLRSRYFAEGLEKRGHSVRLAYFIVDDKNQWKDLQDDAISFDQVSKFRPDALIFELGSADRFPSRAWLNELKRQGCIIVHCGLDYNVYNGDRKPYDEMYAGFGCGIRKKKGDRQDRDALPDIRDTDMVSQITRTDVETLKEYCSIQEPKIFENVPWVSSHSALAIYPFKRILLTAGPRSVVKAYNDDIHGENYAIYGAFNDTSGIEVLITGHFVTDGRERAEREHNRTFLTNVLEYFHTFNPVKYKSKPEQASHTVDEKIESKGAASVISILFLAADPTDASRLRLGEELREIQEKLRLAKLREQFGLHQRMSVRPMDISQALLDVQPQIVHFSGHGTATGALCFENQVGETHPIQPNALAALFEQFAHQVKCVILNACYSETQAKAIAEHIEYVIGMSQAIDDKAAIAFAVGFYQALGAGRTVEDAYKLGCVQVELHGISGHLTPILITKQRAKPLEQQSPQAPSRKVSLQAWNGRYVYAVGGGGGEVLANRNVIDEWATFDLIELGDNKIGLRAYNGDYVCAEGGGGREIIASRTKLSEWETFTMVKLGDDRVHLRAALGQYVSVENDARGEVVARRGSPHEWAIFRLIQHSITEKK